MNKCNYFVKSFEEDFVLKTVKDGKKIASQSVGEIIKKKVIKPNTISFGKKKRLACTYLNKNYVKTYRAQGIIFETDASPDCVYPFDVVVLTDAKKMVVQYFRIKDRLLEYYGHKLIPGFEKFMFDSPKGMFKKISSPDVAFKEVNRFREGAGYKALPKSKFKLVEYNECIFNRSIKIRPIAVFGPRKIASKIADEFGLPWYRNVKNFYESL